MDEGQPIAYEVLDKNVPVFAADGTRVGTVHRVVAAPEEDVFHGLIIDVPEHGRRFVAAADCALLHERGVDLNIDAAAVQSLPEPSGGAATYQDDPGEMKGWHHWAHFASGHGDWEREG